MKKMLSILTIIVMAAGVATAQPGRFDGRFGSGPANRYGYGPGRGGYGVDHDRGGLYRDNWYGGIKFGFVGSHVRSEAQRLDSDGATTGVNFGLATGFNIAPMAAFETGLYYTEKGGFNRNGDNGGKLTYDLNYLEIPLVLKYYIPSGDRAVFQPFVGAYLGLGVGGQIKDYDAKLSYGSFSNGYFRRGDSGLTLGCGVSWTFLYASLGYEWGLANIASDSFAEAHNRALVFCVGFAF